MTTQGEPTLVDELMAKLQNTRGIPDLAKAFVAAWGEIGNVTKNANNPHFGSDYADLSAVLDVIKPAFAAHGLALLQAPGVMAGDKITLQTILMHSSGQNIAVTTELPIGAKATAQAAGSAYTYARRYAASAIAGIAPVDDDGEAASAAPQARKVKPHAPEGGPGMGGYAADSLAVRIEATDSKEALEALKQEVKDLGSKAVADAYVAKLRAHKGKA